MINVTTPLAMNDLQAQTKNPAAPALIPVPVRLPRFESALVLLAVALLGAFALYPAAGPAEAVALFVLAFVGWRRRATSLVHLATFAGVLVGAASIERLMLLWPLPALLAALALWIVGPRAPAGRRFPFLACGELGREAHLSIVASAVVAGAALVLWFVLARPDYSAIRAMFPPVSTPLLMLGVLAFAAVNGALEELAYRGVVLDALDAALGVRAAPVVIQALAFGALHYGGFPRGAAGVALATIYGLMMGTIRRRSRGLLAPWLAHILADTVIGSLLLASQ